MPRIKEGGQTGSSDPPFHDDRDKRAIPLGYLPEQRFDFEFLPRSRSPGADENGCRSNRLELLLEFLLPARSRRDRPGVQPGQDATLLEPLTNSHDLLLVPG